MLQVRLKATSRSARARLTGVEGSSATDNFGQVWQLLTIASDSGLNVTFRVIRPAEPASTLPVLMILGGHRTGSDAVDLFGNVGNRAVVALGYP